MRVQEEKYHLNKVKRLPNGQSSEVFIEFLLSCLALRSFVRKILPLGVDSSRITGAGSGSGVEAMTTGASDAAGGKRPIELSEVILDCEIIIKYQCKNSNHDGEEIAHDHTDNFEDGKIGGWLNLLRRIAHQFCRVDDFKYPKNGGKDRDRRANDPDNRSKHGTGSRDAPE